MKVLRKDIVIPKGTIFTESPRKTVRVGDDHYGCVIGLDNDTAGFLEYCFEGKELMDEYLEDKNIILK